MKKNLIIGILLGFFATFLMSHNAGAASRLGYYENFGVNGISGLPSHWVNNRDTQVSATGNAISAVYGGNFYNSFNWREGQEYVVVFSTSFTAYTTNANKVGSLNAEAFLIEGDNYYTLYDSITPTRSCNNATTCRSVYMHEVHLMGKGNGSEQIKFNGANLFSISDFWSQYTGNGVMSWSGILFESVDEWSSWRSEALNSLNGIHSDTTDIVDTLGEINDKLGQLDTNADKNAEAWNNMQNTDGLIDVGDNTSFMDTFNSINSFFGGIKNVSATDCSFDFSNDVVDLGVLNFCSMPEALRNIIGPIAAIIFSVVDIFLAWGSIKYIVSVIDWARRN